MQCDKCDSEATVFLTQLVDQTMKKICLCEACAKEDGVMEATGFSGMMPETNSAGDPLPDYYESEEITSCPSCGFTELDLQKIGRLGCPDCYDTFSKVISEKLPSIHKGSAHLGKTPNNDLSEKQLNKRLAALQQKLSEAISNEDFEKAAQLRDELKSLQPT